MKLTLAFLLASGAMAACPNACSQHGECGEFDSCDCHAGFQGGDCSERVCMYNWAWVTTANGDLNFDGDRYDGTVYSATVALSSRMSEASPGYGGATLLTQANPGGTWESWPYSGTAQEGHYYMECSNRGLCDRTSGDCVCFDGYTGTACNRMACPEDCSEHGICQTVKDYDAAYKLWDRDMARSCKCDPGYTGPACQTRICPYGNDPLTKTNELFETQFVDIYSTCAGSGTTTDCGTFDDGTAQLGGYVRLTYTDHYGEAYTTDPVAVQTYDSSAAANTVATNVQAALRALPNDVVSSTLTVTAQYCETTVDAITDPGTGATGYTDHPFRILDPTKGGKLGADNTAVYATNGKVLVAGASTQTVNDAGVVVGGNTQLAALPSPMCIRLRVDFNDMPGDLNTLTVDHSAVTYFGETNAQNTNARVSSSVVSDLQITGGSTSAMSIGYTRPSTVVVSHTDVQIDIASKTITAVGAATYGADVNGVFHMNSKIKIECQYALNGVNTFRNLGVYTVSTSTAPTGTVITVKETIVANTCTVASSTVRITQVSNVLTIGQHNLGLTTTVSSGNRVRVVVVSGSVVKEVETTVSSIEYHNDGSNDIGYIILAEEATDVLSADITAGAAALYHHGDGTRENVECSDRGMCQEDGVCKCFTGYTGDDCSIQKAIAM